MTTSTKPHWFRGTPEEWNSLPESDRFLASQMSGEARTQEATRLLALARGGVYKPEQELAKSKTSGSESQEFAKPLTGIRHWTEPVNGIPASRVRDCIIFLLDIKRDPWYRSNCNNRAFVHRFAQQMNEQTPEDYRYDPSAVLGFKRQHIDGEQQPVLVEVVQKPVTEITDKDRKQIRDKYGVNDSTVHYLAKRGCPDCKGKGFVDVSDYPGDPLYEKLASSEPCHCLWE